MTDSFRITIRQLRRANELNADNMGLLDAEKLKSGAPTSYRLVVEDEIEALKEARISFMPLLSMSNSILGWVHPDVYELIVIFEENEGYSDITLAEWLVKTYIRDSE